MGCAAGSSNTARIGGGRAVSKRRITLGSVSVLTPDQARDAAGDVLAKVRFGDDAPHDRAARRTSPMVSELIDAYMRQEVRPTRKARTADLYDMYFRRHIRPALGSKRAREVMPNDIAKLHRKIGAVAPVTANRVVALISGLYSWAARTDWVPQDLKPARGVARYREEGRERFLTTPELGWLGDALREAETVHLAPHGVRHAAATTWAVARPAQIDVVRDLLTHAHIGTTQYYIRRDGIEASRAYAKRIGDIRKGR